MVVVACILTADKKRKGGHETIQNNIDNKKKKDSRDTQKGHTRSLSINLASNKIDVVVVESSTCKQSTVWMESGARDRSRAGLMKKARIRLKRRKICAVDVERFDFVTICAAFWMY